MKTLKTFCAGIALLGLILVAACGNADDIHAIREMPVRGGLFNFALHDSYINLVDRQSAVRDRRGAKHFMAKARTAALGEDVLPDKLDETEIAQPLGQTLAKARQTLVRLLEGGTTLFNPFDAASALTSFDCWLWQVETEDAQTCREVFEETVQHLEAHLKIVTVVLLADHDGRVGSVIVNNAFGFQTLTKAHEATRLSAAEPAPVPTFILGEDEIKELFKDSLKAEPMPPSKFIFYFNQSSSILTADSHVLLQAVMYEISIRKVVEISVVGHTDRVSSAQFNKELSLKRTRWVRQILINRGVDATLIHTTYHGESNPMIKTADGVAEPRNRRVEVIVR